MISIDLVLAIGVVTLTASLTLDRPPGTMNQMAAAHDSNNGPTLEMIGDNYRLTMPMPMPSMRAGRGFPIDIGNNTGAVIQPQEATFYAQPLDIDLVPLRWQSSTDASGVLSFTDIRIPFLGQWQFAVDVLIDEFTTVRFEQTIEFQSQTPTENSKVISGTAESTRSIANMESLI